MVIVRGYMEKVKINCNLNGLVRGLPS